MSLLRLVRAEISAIVDLSSALPAAILRGQSPPGAITQQLWLIGNKSLFFVALTLGFLGAIIVLQTGMQAGRVFGDTSLVGAQLLPLLLRQLGPTLVGLMVATRVGTGIAAELGSMVVTEQVDALRMCDAPPVEFLVVPRFIACLIMVPTLAIFGALAAYVAGGFVAAGAFQTNPATYINFDFVRPLDIAEGLTKAVAFGGVIPVIAAAAGLTTHGGSAGVGEATTRAVVNGSLAVIALDFAIGGLYFPLRTGG